MIASTTPYLDFSLYLKDVFPTYKVQKISLDAGCTCPNRDGSKGVGGCTYCNNSSFTPGYTSGVLSIESQLQRGIDFFARKYKEMRYLAYFQSYTNTYGDPNELIDIYEKALSHPKVVGLIIGTRPDCMPLEILDYLVDLKFRRSIFVYVEYGVESINNEVLLRINRGHSIEESVNAILATHEKGIPVGGHFILGLPGDERPDLLNSATFISSLPLNSIKLHQLQILKGTTLGKSYMNDPDSISCFSLEEYLELVAQFLCRLRPNLYVDRFVSQAPSQLLLAPKWGIKNYIFTHQLIRYMDENGLKQGCMYA